MAKSPTSLSFTVRRSTAERISPAQPTPRELKLLSDIDDQEGLRCQTRMIHFYRGDQIPQNNNPAMVIREALAKLLVFYYPLAGRLREGPARKLVVDCTGEGVLFIEAEADVTLEQFGELLLPPFPCMEELLYDVPGSGGILDSPLLLIQVTSLLCGGFIFALRINHVICDGNGYAQFMMALGEIVRGATTPSIPPVWHRELLLARNPPRVTYTHHEYDEVKDTNQTIESKEMVYKSFFFGPTEVSLLRRHVPTHLQSCSTFDVLTACIWRCRTIALQPDPEAQMRVMLTVNARSKFKPPIPKGYYGNCLAYPVAVLTAKELFYKPLGHALDLVIKAKSLVTEEYMRSIMDLMVVKDRPHFTSVNNYFAIDFTRARFNEIDIGWGKAAYGGSAEVGIFSGIGNAFMCFTNNKGEFGTVIPMNLPKASMVRFIKELDNMLIENAIHQSHTSKL